MLCYLIFNNCSFNLCSLDIIDTSSTSAPAKLMFDGHINHSPVEIRQMIDDIIDSGIKYAVTTPNLAQLKSYISSNQTNKSK